jgi:hypothetical protein
MDLNDDYFNLGKADKFSPEYEKIYKETINMMLAQLELHYNFDMMFMKVLVHNERMTTKHLFYIGKN